MPDSTAADTLVLIVEDSPTQALDLRLALEEAGYQVRWERNGRLALESLQEARPTLIVSDVVMPEMDGYDMCRAIKDDVALKDIPVLLLTALSDPKDVIEGLQCGADNFITKPYTREALLSRIRAMLVNMELRRQSAASMGIEIYFVGKKHFITADRIQILDLLFSTYEDAILKNRDLKRVNEELRIMHAELEAKNEKLQELNDQKSQFLGFAAHDLRNPLAAIQAYSQLVLLEDERLTPEQVEFLRRIENTSEFMAGLVNDLLDLTTIEAGQLQLLRQPIDVDKLVQDSLLTGRLLAQNKGITVRYENAVGALPAQTLDPSKIQQVLDNLISNAVKYSSGGSEVVVRLEHRDGQAVVSVQDQGPGIPAEEIERIFQPFGTTSVQAPGGEKSTGLGLAIARKIVAGHGGRIVVESAPGQGSTFSVTLPVQNNRQDAPAAS